MVQWFFYDCPQFFPLLLSFLLSFPSLLSLLQLLLLLKFPLFSFFLFFVFPHRKGITNGNESYWRFIIIRFHAATRRVRVVFTSLLIVLRTVLIWKKKIKKKKTRKKKKKRTARKLINWELTKRLPAKTRHVANIRDQGWFGDSVRFRGNRCSQETKYYLLRIYFVVK